MRNGIEVWEVPEGDPRTRPLVWEGDGGPDWLKGKVFPAVAVGWYWWTNPSAAVIGRKRGPFATEAEAVADAQEVQ